MKHTIGVIVCAAGKGFRAGFEKNKLLVPLQGERVLKKTLSAFDFPLIDEMIVTSSQEDYEEISSLVSLFPKGKTVLGGSTRGESVFNALQVCTTDIVLIHDGARPFVTREIIENCIESVKAYGSGICAVSCTDTIAVLRGDEIESVPNRSSLTQIQTPQGFFREKILFAYKQAFAKNDTAFTDDSSLFLKYFGKPHICAGARDNIKLTHAEDFKRKAVRCGYGVDTHAFGKEQDFVILGGVKIPSASGLIAHSDGDVVIHALMDALLSAAGLKDIGFYFPDNSEQWKGANSMKMLAQVNGLLQNQGFRPQNISIAIQAEKPRLANYIDDMKREISSCLSLDPTAIGVTAGTNEGLGYVGEGKGITVHAYVLLQEK